MCKYGLLWEKNFWECEIILGWFQETYLWKVRFLHILLTALQFYKDYFLFDSEEKMTG